MSDVDRNHGASWWALACRFLDRFAAGGAGHPNLRADDRFDAWMTRVHRVGDLLDAREPHEPWPWPGLADTLEALVAGDAEPGDAAHAVAWVIDERFARTFPDDWIAGATAGGFELADGDLYPVLETPWSIFQPFLSRPASMSDPRPDELPHARRFRAAELRTDVEFSAGRRLPAAHRPDADRCRQRPADRQSRGVDRPLLDDGAADCRPVARVLAAWGTARHAAGRAGLGRASAGRGGAVRARSLLSRTR